VGTHFCIHKYFFDRSPSWKAIREEELRADDADNASQELTMDLPDDEDDRVTDPKSLEFTPIDARHLSSLPLIRARVVKLLKASRNHMHAANNMLITLVRILYHGLQFFVKSNAFAPGRDFLARPRQIVDFFRVEFAS
jgi:transcription factor C subunit 3